ncbi:PREDICTED: uncharacterized protein LOC108761180, partial [Trachymyrmex cornetzi]|uniref:uncharacterized protein LOC108761180 n=1 Tax=Trachymyrmex cornetzi TaxID=471704 RepID=UPI00084F3869
MILFAWYVSKLANKREFFYVNQLCFPANLHNLKCNLCKTNYCFIKCSWCAAHLCFQCFYINFHPQH